MRTHVSTLVLLVLGGVAAAQPGGSDLPVAPQPAASEMPPPEMQQQPQPPQQQQAPTTQVLDPSTAPTRATFLSTADDQWDVYVDRQAICSTPCTLGLAGTNYVTLKTQEHNPVRLDVGYVPQGDVMVSAKPLSNGMYAGGIVMTSLSGMALATGITLTAVGWGTDRPGMRTAGLITGVTGGVGLYFGIYLMRKALPRYRLGPAQPYMAGNQVGLAGRF